MIMGYLFRFVGSDYYFSWLTWVTDERICLQWLKRVQNVSVLSICDFREDWHSWDCPKVKCVKTTGNYFQRWKHNSNFLFIGHSLCCETRLSALKCLMFFRTMCHVFTATLGSWVHSTAAVFIKHLSLEKY